MADVERLRVPEPAESVPFVLEAVRLVREALREDQAVVGFAGGPFTVAGLPDRGQAHARVQADEGLHVRGAGGLARADGEARRRRSRSTWPRASRAGADVIQLFDSWAGALSVDDYREFAAPYSERVLAAVDVPTIHFATGDAHLLEERAAGGRRRDRGRLARAARRRLGACRPRPRHPGEPRRRRPARAVGARRGRRRGRAAPRRRAGPGHIFNLGHGVAARDRPGRPAPPDRARARDAHWCPFERRGGPDGVRQPVGGRRTCVPYLEDVRGGRPVSDEAVAELAERYRRIGGRSPLDDVTEAQRAALERELGMPVFVGMKHWRPRIAEAVDAALAGGATRIVGLVLAPHYSRLSIGEYRERLEAAVAGRAELVLVESWHDSPGFVDLLADRVRGTDAWVVFTAHSLPDTDPGRGRPVQGAAARDLAPRRGARRASSAGRSPSRARARPASRGSARTCSRSSSGCMPTGVEQRARRPGRASSRTISRSSGTSTSRRKERAAELGLELERIELPNDDPAFVRALAEVVEERLAVSGRSVP